MPQYQGPATIRNAKQQSTQQSPARAYPTLKQASEIVVIAMATDMPTKCNRGTKGDHPLHWS